MKAAISTSSFGALRRSSACRTSGKLVVAPSRTALSVPRIAFALTAASTARPASETSNGPSSIVAPPLRTNGTKMATKSTSGSTTRARVQSVPGPTRAVIATAVSASAQATQTGHACSGVVTATSVTPVSPSSFARGSRRWIGLSGFPATPALELLGAHAVTGRLRAVLTRAKPSAKTISVPVKPARPLASFSLCTPGKA